MKYKEGDVVRVREDLDLYIDYYMEDDGSKVCIVSDMLKFRGECVTIKRAIDSIDYPDGWARGYMIEESGVDFIWTDEMFDAEPVPQNMLEYDAESLSVLYDWV